MQFEASGPEALVDWAYVYSKEGAITVNTNYGTNSGKSKGVVWKKNGLGKSSW